MASCLTAGVTIFLRPGRAASRCRASPRPGAFFSLAFSSSNAFSRRASDTSTQPQYRDDLLLGGPRSFHRPSPFGGRTLPKSGGVLRAQVISYEVVKYVARSGDHYTPRAGGGSKGGGNGRRTVATACAAMPSPRPVNPSLSVVVAFTLTRPGAMPRITATRLIIAAR